MGEITTYTLTASGPLFGAACCLCHKPGVMATYRREGPDGWSVAYFCLPCLEGVVAELRGPRDAARERALRAARMVRDARLRKHHDLGGISGELHDALTALDGM